MRDFIIVVVFFVYFGIMWALVPIFMPIIFGYFVSIGMWAYMPIIAPGTGMVAAVPLALIIAIIRYLMPEKCEE